MTTWVALPSEHDGGGVHEKPCYDDVTVVLNSPKNPTHPLLVGIPTLEVYLGLDSSSSSKTYRDIMAVVCGREVRDTLRGKLSATLQRDSKTI